MDPEKETVEEKDVPEVEVDETQEPEKTVEVDLEEKKSETADLDAKLARLEERLSKSDKRNEYLNRQLQKALNEVKQPQEVQQPELPADEIDQIAQQDWKKAVKLLGRQEAEAYWRELQTQQAKQQQEQSRVQQLETSKQKVRERYPDIEDESSDNAKLYMEVLNENPTLLQNTYGPELAMYKMEEKLRGMGRQPAPLRDEIREEADRETQRRMRIGVSGLPRSSQGKDKKVVLSQQEADMAKELGIPLAEVAKMSKRGERGFTEGVEVDE
jgi:hypothetical protein